MSLGIADGKSQMEKCLAHLKTEFSKLRVGRASVAMIDSVVVDAYGSNMSLKEVAALSTPDAKTLTVQPWDPSLIGGIEKAILAANLGLTPINDGKLIRINMPPLTEDRRKEFVKTIKTHGEDARVALRNVRRQLVDGAKAQKEAGDLTEDGVRRAQDEAQKLTDQFVKEVDKLVEAKSEEVMSL